MNKPAPIRRSKSPCTASLTYTSKESFLKAVNAALMDNELILVGDNMFVTGQRIDFDSHINHVLDES